MADPLSGTYRVFPVDEKIRDVSTGSGAWTYGLWNIFETSTPYDAYLVGISFNFSTNPVDDVTKEYLIEVGIGSGAGKEAEVIEIPYSNRRDSNVGYYLTSGYSITLPEMYFVPAGSIIAVRAASSSTATEVIEGVSIRYYVGQPGQSNDPFGLFGFFGL